MKNKSIILNFIGIERKGTFLINILISIYLGMVVYMSLFDTLKYIWILMIVLPICFCLSSIIVFLILEYGKIKGDSKNSLTKRDKLIIFTLMILGQLLYFGAYYPGGFNLDALGQWDQAHGVQGFSNWHPIATTITYLLLTNIIDNLAFCILIQLVLFCFVCSGLIFDLNKCGWTKKWCIFFAGILALNPAIGMNNVCLIKDVYFSIGIIILFRMVLRIYISDGAWLNKWYNFIVLTLVIVMLNLIRHNSCFITVPTIVLLLVYKQHRIKSISIVLVFGILLGFIEGPLFENLGVEHHSNTTGEVVGVPMSIMITSMLYDYDNAPEECKKFLLDIASYDEWERHFYVGEWDSCKWEFGGTELFENESIGHILRMTLKTIKSCPDTTYQSLQENFRIVWQVMGDVYWIPDVYIEENEYGIIDQHSKVCRHVTDMLILVTNKTINCLVWNLGIYIIIMMYAILYIYEKRQYKKTLFVIPILLYIFGTMLLLAGPNFRYFYGVYVLIIPAIYFVLRDEYKVEEQGEEENGCVEV